MISATYGDEAVAVALAGFRTRSSSPSTADQAGADRLAALLEARNRTPLRLGIRAGDLNEPTRRSDDWPARLEFAVDRAMAARSAGASVER